MELPPASQDVMCAHSCSPPPSFPFQTDAGRITAMENRARRDRFSAGMLTRLNFQTILCLTGETKRSSPFPHPAGLLGCQGCRHVSAAISSRLCRWKSMKQMWVFPVAGGHAAKGLMKAHSKENCQSFIALFLCLPPTQRLQLVWLHSHVGCWKKGW